MLIPCPRVADSAVDFANKHPDKYRDCAPQSLRQFWQGTECMPVEGGHALVGSAEEGLCFYAYYEDSDIFSTATEDDQKMWTLGDVAEFFVKPGLERADYWELHITPNDFVMDIYIADRGKFQAGAITWDEVITHKSGVIKRVEIADRHWSVELCIPWRAFAVDGIPSSGTTWQFAVCRYNYNNDLEKPELSSTAQLTAPGFHRYEEFAGLVF